MKNNGLYIIILLLLISIGKIDAKEQNEKIKIMYFHGTMRCDGCVALENNIIRSVEALFDKEVKNGSFVYESLDFLAEGNGNYVELYKIESQTLIISKVVDQKEVKWVNLDKVWDYAGNFHKMKKYIDKEVRKLLK